MGTVHCNTNLHFAANSYDLSQFALKEEPISTSSFQLPPLPMELKLPSCLSSSSPSTSFSDTPLSIQPKFMNKLYCPKQEPLHINIIQNHLSMQALNMQRNRTKIKKEKPFQCGICLKRFTQKHSLTDHKRIHTGEKPFECDICHKRFRLKYNRKVHRRIHTGEKPYKCTSCNKMFTSKTGLNSHNKRMHPPPILECETKYIHQTTK